MTKSIMDMIENTIIQFLAGDKYETRDNFIDTLDDLEDVIMDRIHETLDEISELTADELKNVGITIEDELEEIEYTDDEPTAREEALNDLRNETLRSLANV